MSNVLTWIYILADNFILWLHWICLMHRLLLVSSSCLGVQQAKEVVEWLRYCNPLPLATDKIKNWFWNVGVLTSKVWLVAWIKLNSQEIKKHWEIDFLLVKSVDCFELFSLGWRLWYQCQYEVGFAVDTDRSLQSSWPWRVRFKH